jgi:NAD dependent epimerase/dehydratase
MASDVQYDGARTVVTGADGFIGSHLAETLVLQGARVTALSLYNSFGERGWLDDIPSEHRRAMNLVAGDVRDPHFVRKLVESADVVFHLAALIAIPYSYIAPQSYVDTNVTGTLNMLEACRAGAVGRFVHTSTSEVYGTAQFTPITEEHPLQGQSPYAASKIGADKMVEAYARSFDTPAVILRPFNTYGPRQSERAVVPTIIRQALQVESAEIRIGDVSPIRDLNYVDDTVSAFLAIGRAEVPKFGTVYNAGSGVGVSIAETISRISKLIDGPVKPVVVEESRRRPVTSEVMTLIASSDRFRELTGWAPRETLDSGLERTINWWRHRIAGGRTRPDLGYLV